MFPINTLASSMPLNFSTPPRNQVLLNQQQQQQTPESNANVTMMGHNSAAKALSFSAASLMTSTPSKFSLGSFVSTPGPKMECVTPSKPWPPPTDSLATPGPHHSTPQRLQNSVMATPESMPISSPPDPQALNMSMDKSLTDSGKRGRPRADLITSLIQEGTSSPSGIKCSICGRVFPREKSLQAHIRTHTGEKPYSCDYPGCSKSFRQSGQLKTHQRLHAGERPFACAAPGCQNRYTHANRHCPIHPYIKPQRSTDLVMQPTLTSDENCNREIAKWLEKYRNERQDKTTTTPAKDPQGLPSLAEHHHNENFIITPIKKSKTKRGLTEELEQQENSPMKRKKFTQQQNGIHHQLQFSTQQQPPQPQLMFHHNQPQLSLFPSFAVSAAATTSTSGLEAPPSKSPMKNLPALALLNSRSLLEERLKISPPRKAQQAALADITASTNEGPSPITTATSTLAGVSHSDPEAQARSALSVLLAAAANRDTTTVPTTSTATPTVVFPRSPEKQQPSKMLKMLRTPPRSPLKSLKPKKRWMRTVMSQETEIKTKSPVARRIQGEELGGGAGVEEIGQEKVTLVSSSPPSGNSNEDLDSLAMPIRWSEPDERPVNIFRGRNNGGGSERRSPLSLQIASTLIAMSSESDNNPSSSEADHPDNAESADTPLNLSKK